MGYSRLGYHRDALRRLILSENHPPLNIDRNARLLWQFGHFFVISHRFKPQNIFGVIFVIDYGSGVSTAVVPNKQNIT